MKSELAFALSACLACMSIQAGEASAQSAPVPDRQNAPEGATAGPLRALAAPPPPVALPGGLSARAGMPQQLRWMEDWSLPTGQEYRPSNPLESLRHLPITEDSYLSIGGEVRHHYRYWEHQTLAARPGDRLENLGQRLRLVGDLHIGPRLRIFAELGDNRELAANRPSTPNRGQLDIQQAFADISLPLGDKTQLTIRPGRFEMPLGNGQLVGLRDGTNARYTYQGVRAALRLENGWYIDGFAVRPMLLREGFFDDRPNPNRHFNGITIVAPKGRLLPDTQVELYQYDVYNSLAKFPSLTGPDHRHSWGLRLSGKSGQWFYDVQATFQSGSFVDKKIRAWGFNNDIGYALPAYTPLAPRIGMKFDAFSGDADPDDGTLGTFAPPAPRAAPGFLNFSNFVELHPYVRIEPARSLTLSAGPRFFWREARNDVTYIASTKSPGISPVGSAAIGTELEFKANWAATRNLSYRLHFAHFSASDAFKAGGGQSSMYAGLWQTFRF